jgi:hypothetical protein
MEIKQMALRVDRPAATKNLFLPAIGLSAFLMTGSGFDVHAFPQQRQGREIVSEDFTRNRSAAKVSQAASSAATAKPSTRPASSNIKKRRIYRLTSTQATTVKPSSANPLAAAKTSAGSLLEQVGITIWRLRASTSSDDGPKIVVQEGGGTMWLTPERTQTGTLFTIGERVRLSIESPRTGYLYVIDREQYADGTLGEPSVIFPTLLARGGDNRVSAGMLVEIPDQKDRMPYFNLTRHREDQIGELLTVLVTPQPIAEIKIGMKQSKLSPEQVLNWESMWEAQAELFEMEGGAGASWTKEEQQAGGVSGRSLTQEEPTPQTIYRVRVKPGNPLLVNVPLRYGRANAP